MGTPINFGWVNSTTPGFATVNCGYVVQTEDVSTTGSVISAVGFNGNSSWSTPNWTNTDGSGSVWACETGGVYALSSSQNLTLFNAADATNPVVNVTLTVTSTTTSEFNTVFQTSVAVPITTAPITMNVTTGGLANVDPGTTMTLTIQSPSGNVTVTSGATVLPSPAAFISWNLIAQGPYGNVGLVVA